MQKKKKYLAGEKLPLFIHWNNKKTVLMNLTAKSWITEHSRNPSTDNVADTTKVYLLSLWLWFG